MEYLAVHQSQSTGRPSKRERAEILEAVLQGLAAKEAGATANSSAQAQHKFAHVQLLATLKGQVMRGNPLINLDFATFTLARGRFMEGIASRVVSTADPNRRSIQDNHRSFVRNVLREGHGVWSREIAATFKEHIEQEGTRFSTEARHQSSKHTPKDLRPELLATQLQTCTRASPTRSSTLSTRHTA